MSAKKIIAALLIILLINVVSIVSVEYGRHKPAGKNKQDNTNNTQVQDTPKNVDTSTTDQASQDNGKLSTGGLFVDKAKADSTPNYKALEKSKNNQARMRNENHWIGTNYVKGDITTNTWKVQRGDTLCEIAEAKYGDARKWTRIVELNRKSIGRVRDVRRVIIFPGQTLKLR